MTQVRLGMKAMTLMLLAAPALGLGGCRKLGLDDQEQVGAAAGEAMASLDETVDGRAVTAMLLIPIFRTPEPLRGPLWRRALDTLMPSAYATSCYPATFTPCAAGVRTRQFSSCTVGPSTLAGSVTLTFNRPALCAVVTTGDAVTRTADFTLTGPWGGTLAVTSPGGGQTLTRTADGFEYSVAGMERVLTGPGGRKLFDISTRTTAPLVVTGTSRADLKIISGSLEVSHNIANYKVTLSADNLAWSATCNCAASGRLTGTVAGGGKLSGKSASVTITSCGHADVTIDGDTESVTLDRCAGI
jgi:hypothetical protein